MLDRLTSTRSRWLLGTLTLLIALGSASAGGYQIVIADSPGGTANPDAEGDTASYAVTVPMVAANYVPPVAHPFGVQVYGSLSDANIGHAQLRASGARWVRWELSWGGIVPTEPTEGSPAQYNWYCDDTFLTAHQLGIELIVTINNNPRWAAVETPDGYYANGPIKPYKLDDFAQFVGAMVERYDGDGIDDAPGSPIVRYYEFYNEPDNGDEIGALRGGPYWGPYGQEYADMLCAVYPVAKAASPHAMIVFGGIAHDGFFEGSQITAFVESFPSDVFAAGGGQCFDIMDFHFYFFAQRPWDDYGPGLLGKANAIRALMQDAGIADKPMVCTEAGAPSAVTYTPPDPKATAQVQARRAAVLGIESVAADLESFIWWMWKDRGVDPLAFYGLVTTDLQAKSSLNAYRVARDQVGDAELVEIPDLGADLEAYHFRTPQGTALYALWVIDDPLYEPADPADEERDVTIPLARATVTDLYGNTRTQQDGDDGTVDGRIVVTIGLDPTYVEELP